MNVAIPTLGTEWDLMKSVSMFSAAERARARIPGRRLAQVDIPAEATTSGSVRIRQGGSDPQHYEVWAESPAQLLGYVTRELD